MVVVISIIFVPLLLLLWMQVRFLAYQNEWITLAHQIVVTLNGVMLVLSGINIAAKLGIGRGRASWRAARRLSVLGIAAVSLAAVMFSWCIAVVPESQIDRAIGWKTASARLFKDWWRHGELGKDETPRYFRRYLHVKGKTVAYEEPSDEIIAAYIQKGDDEEKAEEKAWEHVDQLDLSGRSLRYGRFDLSKFKRVDLSNARLDHATLEEAELRRVDLSGADLTKARLRGVDLSAALVTGGTKLDETNLNLKGAKLNDVDLSGRVLQRANLTDAELRGAKLAGTDLRGAKLQRVDLSEAEITPHRTKLDEAGLNLRGAKLNGINLASRKLHNVNLSRAELRGADLSGAELHGADLRGSILDGALLANAKLYGADLSRAKLYGADLIYAEFHGANLRRAELYGANLTYTQFHGADLSGARFYGANLAQQSLANVYLWNVRSEKPGDWSEITEKIREGLRLRLRRYPSMTEDIETELRFTEERAATATGMRMPANKPTMEDCIWHDRYGPFKIWPDPSTSCTQSLVEFACNDKIGWVMKGIVEIHSHLVHDHDVVEGNTLAFLNTGSDQCPTLDSGSREKLCEGLERLPEGRSSGDGPCPS